MINYEASLTLKWFKNCILTDITTQTERERMNTSTSAIFQITDTQLHVPVGTLSTKDDNNFLEQLKSGLKGTIK